jgi:hypothetical protein
MMELFWFYLGMGSMAFLIMAGAALVIRAQRGGKR